MTTSPAASPLRRFFAPPHRDVVLLPDNRFLVRAVPVVADAGAPPVAEQISLALETLSPFGLAQLYHGYLHPAGHARALIFAAYRKRFLSEETAAWADAELVIPAFAVLAAAPAEARTARLTLTAESATVVYFGDDATVPAQVLVRPIAAGATDDERAAVRTALVHALPEGTRLEEWAPPVFDGAADQRALTFVCGERRVVLAPADVESLDVRDKDQLDARRRAKKRDVILWRTFIGLAASLLLCGLLEIALIGGDRWIQSRKAHIASRTAEVEKVTQAHGLANQLETIASKRLLAMEMLNTVRAQRPGKTQLISVRMENLYSLQASVRTSVPTEVNAYKAALAQLPECESVEVKDNQTQGGFSNFTLVVKFKSGALKSEEASS